MATWSPTPFERDRDSEFHAHGSVDELAARARAARETFADDVAAGDLTAPPPHGPFYPEDVGTPLATTRSGVLVQILRELQQHLGQMEMTRDVLLADG